MLNQKRRINLIVINTKKILKESSRNTLKKVQLKKKTKKKAMIKMGRFRNSSRRSKPNQKKKKKTRKRSE